MCENWSLFGIVLQFVQEIAKLVDLHYWTEQSKLSVSAQSAE